MTRVLAAFLAAQIAAMPALAKADIFQAVGLTGSEALITHALSQPGMPARAAHDRAQFEARRGYARLPGIDGVRGIRFRPVLSFDPNVNGGVPGDRVEVAGLTFMVDPDLVGKSGVLLGMEGQAWMRENIAPGMALDLGLRGLVAHAPQQRATRIALDAHGCIRQQVNASRYLHGCSTLRYRSTRMGSQVSAEALLGMTQAFGGGAWGYHAVTGEMGLRRIMPRGGTHWNQGFVRVSTVSALRNGTALTASLEIGQAVRGAHVSRINTSFGVLRVIAGRPTSVSAFYNQASGGIFLGAPRRDHTVGLAVTRQLNDQFTMTASVSQTRSNASLFSTGPSIGLGVQARF